MCWFTKAKKEYPSLPERLGEIDIAELYTILQTTCPDARHYGVMDAHYELTSLDEYRRFLKWYHDTHKYTWDEYDCSDYAWLMRAEALKWMSAKFPFGWIWASGQDEEYRFPSHGFNWVLDHNRKLYFCDELCVAAPNDDFIEFYPVEVEDMLI